VVRSVKALETLVDGLGDYAADAPPQVDSVPLAPLLDEVLGSLRDQCQRQKVSVEKSVPTALCIEADRRRLAAALRHLTHHALASMPRGGDLVITAVATTRGIEIEVADSGRGLSESELAGPFLPLRGEPGPASGLERSIAHHVAAAHGGEATARNCPEGGAALTLIFPVRGALKAVA
jgi:signal transduction histidine kinase